jgi:hypothetical protein
MANSYLSSNTGTATNAKKFTLSMWIKRSKLCDSNSQRFYQGYKDGNDRFYVMFDNTSGTPDAIWIYAVTGGTVELYWTSSRRFRDTNGWYHFVFSADSTLSTAADRLKVYVNGVLETSFTKTNNPSQNIDWGNQLAQTNGDLTISGTESQTQHFDGYMSHVAFVDGQALAPTEFGETDSTSGIWKFKSPSGITWGNNGYHLKFENSGALGTDSSGNSNNFTVNGTLKQSLNTPSNSYATFNPLFQKSLPSTVNMGNTRLDQGSSAWKSSLTTIGASAGKWYAEFKAGTISSGSPYKYNQFGVVHESITSGGTFGYVGDSDYGWGLNWGGNVNHDGQNVSGYTGFTTGDIISVAMDLDNHKVYWRKNGAAWMNGGDPTSGSTGTGAQSLDTGKIYFFAASVYANECFANFGNGFFGTTAITSAGSNGNGSLFEYDVPSGYYALNTKNINTYG